MSSHPIERRAANRLPLAPLVGDAFGLRGAVDSVLQHGRLVTAVFCLVFAAAAAYAVLGTPVYRSDTLIQIESRSKSSLLPELGSADRRGAESDRPNVSGEIEVMGSREVLLPVISQTGADIQLGAATRWGFVPVGARQGIEVLSFTVPVSHLDRPFELTLDQGRWELADEHGKVVSAGQVGSVKSFQMAGQEARLHLNAPLNVETTRVTLRQLSPVKAYEEVNRRLRLFEPSRDSSLVRISFEDRDPVRAAAFLNALVDRYLARSVQRQRDDSAKALDFVEVQLPLLRERLNGAETELSRYQVNNRAAPLNVEADALLRQRGDLERQAVELRVRRDLLAQTLTAQHPDLAAVLRQIATVEGALARLSGDAGRLPGQHRDVVRLQREAQAESQTYTAMLNHAQQLRILGTAWQPAARVLDRAAVAVEPFRPKPSAVLSVGAGAGLLMGLLAALLTTAFQPTVSNALELQSPANPATLAVIPESAAQLRLMEGRLTDDAVIDDLGTHRLLARAAPDDPAVESLRSVHLSLMLRERSMATQVIMVTSPAAGTGKSFVAANLAALMAETGKRVLLVETDLRRPGLHQYVGIDEFALGLTDLLAGTRSLAEVVQSHPSVRMDLILQGTTADKSGTLLLSQAFEELLIELRSRYDHIVINTAPMLPSRDALAVGRVADIALMVVRAEQSLVAETRAAMRRLEQSGIKLEGLLFNGVKRSRLNAPVLT